MLVPNSPFRSGALHALLVGGLMAMAGSTPAFAGAELITNGNFSSWTVNNAPSSASTIITGGQTSGSGGATLTGWTNTAYAFVFSSGTAASSTGATISGTTNLYLWGPDGSTANNTYSANGLTSAPVPGGGSFVASDGAYQNGFLSQTITGLTVGQVYNLSFLWAAAQQSGFNGATSEGWNVFWGTAAPTSTGAAATYTTGYTPMASHGFTPWSQAGTTLVASSTTMVLSFLAIGTPSGTPPFSLIDGVSLQVPEPAGLLPFLAGTFGLLGFAALHRRRAAG